MTKTIGSDERYSVSVVIPAYNAEQSIARAIDSVLAQTFRNFELIIVDDGSTDSTRKIVESYSGKVRYFYQTNTGVSAARNTGILASKSKWIAFLDADDEWLPTKLQMQIELLDRNPELKWCTCNFIRTDGIRKSAVITTVDFEPFLKSRDVLSNYFLAAAAGRCHVGTQAVMIKRDVFEEVGLFEVGRPHVEDLDMWMRIGHRYPQIGFLAEPLVIVHLDVPNPEFDERRIKAKTGINEYEIILRHLDLARKHGTTEQFIRYASLIARRALLACIYHGHKVQALMMTRELKVLFPWHLRVCAYILTLFPRLTSTLIKFILYIRYRLGLERDVSRRWISYKTARRKNC